MASLESTDKKNFDLTETLQRQLRAYSVSGEIGKIIAQAQSIEEVFKGLCLGFRDLADYNRVMVMGVDTINFCLKPLYSVGFDEDKLESFRPEINFTAGEYADAIFCNKHVLVDPVPDTDLFSTLECKAYVAFPMLERVMTECWQAKNCQKTDCPCYDSENQYCWTNLDAGLDINAGSEDARRYACIKCKQFKCESLFWLDLTDHVTITGEDTAMIYASVAQAGLAMETFKIYRNLINASEELNATYHELQKMHQLLQKDVQEASQIQQQLLPSSFPRGILDIYADYRANLNVSGDYYDCFELDNDAIAFVVADVSGHGTSAAMLMSMFKIMLKSSPSNGISPATTLKNINKIMVSEIDSGKFITVFYAIWLKKKRELIYTSAGHNPIPIMNKKTGEIELLKSSGLFIGVMPDITVKDSVLKLDGDYRINLYTDGINEAMNSAKEQFGHVRIRDIMQKTANKSCKEFVETLMKDVYNFCCGEKLADDATILVCDL